MEKLAAEVTLDYAIVVVMALTTAVFDCFRFMALAEIGRCRISVPPPQTHQGGLLGIRSVRSPLRRVPLLAAPIATPLQGDRPERPGLLCLKLQHVSIGMAVARRKPSLSCGRITYWAISVQSHVPSHVAPGRGGSDIPRVHREARGGAPRRPGETRGRRARGVGRRARREAWGAPVGVGHRRGVMAPGW